MWFHKCAESIILKAWFSLNKSVAYYAYDYVYKTRLNGKRKENRHEENDCN